MPVQDPMMLMDPTLISQQHGNDGNGGSSSGDGSMNDLDYYNDGSINGMPVQTQ
jgi:hypothetical protein